MIRTIVFFLLAILHTSQSFALDFFVHQVILMRRLHRQTALYSYTAHVKNTKAQLIPPGLFLKEINVLGNTPACVIGRVLSAAVSFN